MRGAHLLIALISLALVAGIVAWEWSNLTSPGPLHPSHANVAALKGSDGCAACHGGGGLPMADSCVKCHEEIKDQLDRTQGIHGSLDRTVAQACASCHNEHSGAKIALVSELIFEAANVPVSDAYDHKFDPDFNLVGQHTKIKCEQCHIVARAPSLKKGQKRFLGLSQECVACHKDSHEGAFGTDCVSCHGQVHAFKEAPGFVHEKSFPLEGAHKRSMCVECHETSGPHSVAGLIKVKQTVRTCVACHEDVHKGTLGTDCASCHGVTKPFNQAAEFKHIDAFPLTGGHEGRTCKACHEDQGPRSVAALKTGSLTPRECAECHTSPHKSDVIRIAATSTWRTEGAACAACHSALEKTFLVPAAKMTPDQHAATGFTLSIPHDKVECAACHADLGKRAPLEPGKDFTARFAAFFPGRAQQDCAACHKDPHLGQFDKGPTKGRCIDCHDAVHFKPAVYDAAHHQKSKFPLTGAHNAVACSMCHKDQDGVRRFVPTSTRCDECHKDVHNGSFDGPGKAKLIEGREGCARCHTTTDFNEIKWTGPAHKLWTGYELKGFHATTACVDCHKPLPKPDANGRRLGVAPKDCNSCHADPHAGQFRQKDITDCARCHTETQKYTETIFDHNRDSRYKLDETHINVACAACHKTYEVAGGPSIVRYKPLGINCEDCHGSQNKRKEKP